MASCYTDVAINSTPLLLLEEEEFLPWTERQNLYTNAYITSLDFKAKAGNYLLLLDEENKLRKVIVIFSTKQAKIELIADLPLRLPLNSYHLENFKDDELVILGWSMGAYQFTRYKKALREPAQLVVSKQTAAKNWSNAIAFVRDLINTPANDMGPKELSAEVANLGEQYDANFTQLVGEELLAMNFPAIHAVGRASSQQPRLLELTWGKADAPKVVLIGKGVSFDSGGLDIKPSSAMRNMKKDMGGAANVLGLAEFIMSQGLNINLRVVIAAVENAISGDSFRPGDIITMRNKTTVEIDNTDAEGRLILADCLAYAGEKEPDIMIDFATLTGAARVAVGTEISTFFTNDPALAKSLAVSSNEVGDPVWELPLYRDYLKGLLTPFADLKNCGDSYAGAITAALFLQEFFPKKVPWIHFDIMAWNLKNRPAHPEGGEAMGIRSVYNVLSKLSE